MILTTKGYWRSFFDSYDPLHLKARSDILIFDKEKIIIESNTAFEVVSQLRKNCKSKEADWFIDYYLNTTNVRIYLLGKEEFEAISISALKNPENLEKIKIQFISKKLNFDNTLNYD
ncbi:hypothetical protein HY990_01825 [Candidatus Micrarchaeota archaeon]|nr:hypothetical protein [Candidatus Micrarchaeota archaeon]